MDEKEQKKFKSVLFSNRTFLPSYAHLKFYLNKRTPQKNKDEFKLKTNDVIAEDNKSEILSDTPTTENAIPHLLEEATIDAEVKESIEGSIDTVKKQRKKRWLNVGFLILNLVILVVIFVVQFMNEPPVSFGELLTSKLNWWWLIVAIALFMLINFVDSARVYLAIKKVSGRSRPWLSYKSTINCRFYDAITPLATGGQPFQVFYLNKRGLNASSATSVPLAKYIYAQVTYIVFSVIILVLGSGIVVDLVTSPVVLTLCYVGLALNLVLILAILFLSVSKKVAPRMMFGILKMLKWMHLIKDSRSTFKKVMRIVKDYIKTFRMFMTSGWLVFFEFLLSVLFLLLNYSIAFVVYCIFCEFDISVWYTCLVLQLVCDLAISFIPIPGGAGTAELSFQSLFAPMYAAAGASNVFVYAILFYRIMTYYGYLIQGGLLLLYDFAIGNKKIEPMLQRFRDEDRRARESNLVKMLEENGQTVDTDTNKLLEENDLIDDKDAKSGKTAEGVLSGNWVKDLKKNTSIIDEKKQMENQSNSKLKERDKNEKKEGENNGTGLPDKQQ